MKFVCLGYIDEALWEAMPESERTDFIESCFNYDDELRRGKHFLGGEALASASNSVTLKMRNGSVGVTDGPFSETKEVLGGILLLEANDLNHAISLMSNHPGVKLGPFEVRAADENINQLIAEHSQKSACNSLT
ncbi:YciI family protein [Motiliproteus sp. MSK22-1]|uniref:YciI family protein n=1 Tax=Motiliproteus sp. MSK22-1 TaxID=1897630 RepID=UPI000977DC76|nr:YciI family protein [Motiliproteus sp. MSK22-1]OMH25795.1 dehydrogenase [Motiliproteus sp. MSK22-1]